MLILSFVSCSETKTYYETPIESWLSKNLNDYSSYEPLEFSVLTNRLVLFNQINYSEIENVIRRKADVSMKIIAEIEKSDGIDSTEISKMSLYASELFMLRLNPDRPFITIDSINRLLDMSFEDQDEAISKILNPDLSDLYAQYEGTSNRYQVEVNKQLEKFGTNLKNIDADLKNGLFVNHKFRAKNPFGALVINSILFKLDSEKITVLHAIENK